MTGVDPEGERPSEAARRPARGSEGPLQAGVLVGCMVQVVALGLVLVLVLVAGRFGRLEDLPLTLVFTVGQVLWMGPLYVYTRRRGSPQMASGVMLVAVVTFMLAGTCSVFFSGLF